MNYQQQSARLYDKIYHFKDYAAEVATLQAMIAARATRPYHTLLDVGCGTGNHLIYLKDHYACTGIDYSPAMLDIAREKLPDMSLHEGDMRTFALDQTFDVVACLFSAVGYMQTQTDLNLAVTNMARHVAPGGLLIVEAWLYFGDFNPQHMGTLTVDEPDLKLSRMSRNRLENDGRLSIMDMHHMVSTPGNFDYFIEQHAMGLFTHDEYLAAVADSGLTTSFEAGGLTGRGMYFGVK